MKNQQDQLPESIKTFAPTVWYNWKQATPLSDIEMAHETGEHLIIGYQILEVPEFDDQLNNKAGENYINCLLRQKTFIDTVYNIFLASVENFNSTLELRIANDPVNKKVDCYILLRFLVQYSFYDYKKLKKEFERVIPKDYVLRELEDAAVKTLLRLDKQALVEVRKETNFLPVGEVFTRETKLVAPLHAYPLKPGESYQIPCSKYIELSDYNWVNLYKMLQEANEAIQLRISLSSLSIFDVEKSLAFQCHHMIGQTYQQINNSDIQSYLHTYNKYLASSRLFSVKIQVAANTEPMAMSIANAFCTQLAYGRIKTSLVCFPLGAIDLEIRKNDWEECNHYFYPFFMPDNTVAGINLQVSAFMKRMPYLSDQGEAAALFRLPIAKAEGIPGVITKPIKPFYQPSPKERTDEEIVLGHIITEDSLISKRESNALAYSMPVSDLTKHGLIVGSTGSGKTNTTLNFVRELTEKGIPFLLIEPVKSEYYDELENYFRSKKLKVNRFNFKNPFNKDGTCNQEYLRFNPLIPIPGISVIQHLSYIKGCFNAAFPMHGIMPMILEECIYNLYNDRFFEGEERRFFNKDFSPPYLYDQETGSHDDDTKRWMGWLSLDSLKTEIDTYLSDKNLFSKSDRLEFGNYLMRRIEKITKGVLGNAFCPELWLDLAGAPERIANNLNQILKEPTIIELEDLPDNDEKALVMAFLLTYIFEHRQIQMPIKKIRNDLKEKFKFAEHIHITIIEEAHRLLSSSNAGGPSGGEDGTVTQDSKSKSISLFIDMLAEIRAKGEGIFIVEQIPTKLVSDVIKNTNLKIMHRITSKDDRHYLGEAMNMNEQQKNYVTTLKTGEAIIFDEQLNNPIFVKMQEFK